MGTTLVLGGARSGKTAVAEQIAARTAKQLQASVTYVATAQRSDAEMAERIARHRTLRPASWTTVEEPLHVADWLAKAPPGVVLVDCLSLLLNNWMFLESASDAQLSARIDELTAALRAFRGEVVIVSNEVGHGIVPADALSRRYRDWLGWFNQAVAAASAQVYFVVAGIAVDVRKWQAQW
ncbi:bifunctional adenosylcobinamide kinase/adenosylcobinamide-phosphate guanylyltransferase [Alicyclobacillus cycloheptanicus]|uniref:Adenosylcobinamide kinase n=1 Tax=Alicyclobacillus cycloheptanicus TaxID=1457 RepID=A0ABT9XFM1_9BACL|nr:bifunctional adenosylcobinamide kinase/adenosylcobinamide-phosphate guanylyltransferase [Alicyclobacillus cycloheptanicus]MDQ0189096.1 adenosylcobinamide kinase/adenosylcobinamide-phosphate guanylyltransferase [Alicyclobacillus cycloheptanicus]WDM00229.1 bifunctional adenosylcobinamide kinase/adenosylcobinamide-phosphate guanylyltransferase [Alicyclobacillus cycloheptanicus]